MIFKCSERSLVSPRVFFFPAPVLAPRGVSACHRPLLQVPSDKPETLLFQDELELEAGEEAPCWSFGGKAGLAYPSEVAQWMEFPLDTAWGKLVFFCGSATTSDVWVEEVAKGTHLGVCAGLGTHPSFPLWGTALRPQ